MNRRHLKSFVILSLLSGSVAACEKRNGARLSEVTAAATSSAPTSGSPAAEPELSELPLVKPGELKDGPVYLAVAETGIVLLDRGTAKLIQPLRYSVKRMVHGPDGAVWVAAIDGTFRIAGGKSTQIGEGTLDALAVISANEVWGIGTTGIHHWSGGAWSVEEQAVLGNVTLVRDIGVDAEGNIWVASTNQLHERKKGQSAWTTANLTKHVQGEPFFQEFGVGPDGTLYVTWSGGLLKLRAGEWTRVSANLGYTSPDHIYVSPVGTLAVVGGLADLFVIPAAGPPKKVTPKSANIAASRWKDAALDGRGRLWLATDNGLAVLEKDGRRIEHWQPGTLAGVPGAVDHLLVVGNGPDRLPRASAPATGTVVGKVIRDGTPVSNTDLQICASPDMMFEKTPCENKPFVRSAKTDDGGQFHLPDVPIGSYGFAIKANDKWMITIGGGCCTAMKDGKEFDVGALRLK